MIKAVIFDIDGVLVDSFNANAHYYRDLLNCFGYNLTLEDYKKSFFHLPLKQAIEVLTGEKSETRVEEIWKAGKEFPYPINLFKNPEGSFEIIKELSRKYKLAIVTSRVRNGVNDYFRFSKLEKYFPVVVTYEDYSNPKPDPEPLLVALQKLGVKPEEAVYVGDALSDFESAKSAGVGFIGFKTEFPNTKNVKSFNNLYEAIRYLPKSNLEIDKRDTLY